MAGYVNHYRGWNEDHRLAAGDKNTILRDMIRHIRKGEAECALDMLHRYVQTADERGRVEQYRYEAIR